LPRDDVLRPLSPLRFEEFDQKRYLPLDSTQDRFDEFTSAFARPERWTTKGHLIVATGDRGFGKTSLIQRCGAWLRDQAREKKHYEVVPVDLSDEGWAPRMAMNDRIEETLEFTLEALSKRIPAEQREDLRNLPSPRSKFRKLSSIISDRVDAEGKQQPPIIAVVLLRRYSSSDEVTEYYNFARKGLVFFAEAYEQIDDIKALKAQFNRIEANALLLELDALKAGDVAALVTRIRAEEGNLPAVPSEIVDEIEQSFITSRMSAGELARMAWGSLRIAADRAAPELKSIHIAEYYRTTPRQGPEE
jgi:hypothetical protein